VARPPVFKSILIVAPPPMIPLKAGFVFSLIKEGASGKSTLE
jgi:hypothetical protein